MVFVVAGLYNIGWGLYAAMDPQWLFRFAGMPLANHPQIFVCLGMVIGLYGVLYLEVARVPEQGWLVAFVGLTGKILGPIGLPEVLGTTRCPHSTLPARDVPRVQVLAWRRFKRDTSDHFHSMGTVRSREGGRFCNESPQDAFHITSFLLRRECARPAVRHVPRQQISNGSGRPPFA